MRSGRIERGTDHASIEGGTINPATHSAPSCGVRHKPSGWNDNKVAFNTHSRPCCIDLDHFCHPRNKNIFHLLYAATRLPVIQVSALRRPAAMPSPTRLPTGDAMKMRIIALAASAAMFTLMSPAWIAGIETATAANRSCPPKCGNPQQPKGARLKADDANTALGGISTTRQKYSGQTPSGTNGKKLITHAARA
jgi:hypothetical protein